MIVSWNNVSAGHDLFGGDSRELLEGGYAFVGVTTQRVGVHGIAPMNLGLVDWDKDRYGSLSISSDDYSFDIFTQAARAVGPIGPATASTRWAASTSAISSRLARHSRRAGSAPT